MSGDELPTRFGVLCINALWFLPALFWCRNFFYLLHGIVTKFAKSYMPYVVLGTSLLITLVISITKKHLPSLPLCFIQGLGALFFYAMGWFIKRVPLPIWMKIIALLCWPLAVLFGKIEMIGCYYKIFPLDVIGACGATFLLYDICLYISQIRWTCVQLPVRFLNWAGINSLLMLCMHDLDRRTGFIWSLKCRIPYLADMEWTWHSAVIHFCMAIILTYIVSKIPIISRIYK